MRAQRKEEYRQEALHRVHITETEADRLINQRTAQAQQEATQEAHQYIGRVTEFQEAVHTNKIRHESAKQEKAEKEATEAEARAKKAERSQHNTEHKHDREETTPNRSKPKAKSGPSPKKGLPDVPPFPTGEQDRASASAPPKSDNPESSHEKKGKPGRPAGVKQDKTKQEQATNKPAHDTDKIEDPEFWKNNM